MHLAPQHHAILRTLKDARGPMRLSDLAASTGGKPGSIKVRICQLKANGFAIETIGWSRSSQGYRFSGDIADPVCGSIHNGEASK